MSAQGRLSGRSGLVLLTQSLAGVDPKQTIQWISEARSELRVRARYQSTWAVTLNPCRAARRAPGCLRRRRMEKLAGLFAALRHAAKAP